MHLDDRAEYLHVFDATPAIGSTHDRDGRRAGAGRDTAAAPPGGEASRAGGATRCSATRSCCRRCVVFGTFIFYPFVKNFWLGLYRTPPFPGLPPHWVGFASTATC